MTSVIRSGRIWQPSFLGILGLGLLVLAGCTPPSEKKASPGTTAAKRSAPEQPAPEQPAPSQPAPEQPAPEQPAPEQPAPEQPAPEQPAPEQPAPEQPPAVKSPSPEKPAESPSPEKPAAQSPAEEKPAPAASTEAKPAAIPAEKDAAASAPAAAAAKPTEEKPASAVPAAGAPAEEKPATQLAAAPAAPAEKAADASVSDDTLSAATRIPTPQWLPKPVELLDAEAKDEAAMKAYTEDIPETDVKFDMVPIKGGKFTMGSPDNEQGRNADEGPQHEVTIEPFWMGKHEVTWDEYELWGLKLDVQRRKIKQEQQKPDVAQRDQLADAVAMPTNPYTDMTFSMGKEGYPAICMTQLAAKLYCKWLSAKTGRYYRLPTEAEWEYACRAGTTTAYSFGDDPKQIGDYAWYVDNSDDKYHKVGQKKPNPWGLYDMHGNVAEWVVDQYVPDFYKQFAGKTTHEPFAPATTEYSRAVRGGSWVDDPAALRSAARRASDKDWKKQDPQIPQSIWYLTDADFLGFRVIRPLKTPSPEEAKKYELDEEQVTELIDYQKAQHGKQ